MCQDRTMLDTTHFQLTHHFKERYEERIDPNVDWSKFYKNFRASIQIVNQKRKKKIIARCQRSLKNKKYCKYYYVYWMDLNKGVYYITKLQKIGLYLLVTCFSTEDKK